MKADDILRDNEINALSHSQFVSNVTGKSVVSSKKKIKSFGAVGIITAMVAVFGVIFSSGNMIPSAISERLIEETDVQYADAVESKMLVFQQALLNGEIPSNTASILKDHNVLVGYLDNGSFKETNQNGGSLVLKMGDKIITPENFISEVHSNANLYNAFNLATYSRAAYYYDESAEEVLKVKSSRNNYTGDSDFDEVMSDIVGSGSNISVNSVSLVEKEDENGEKQTEYSENGEAANSKEDAWSFVYNIAEKNTGSSSDEATINSASVINIADTISKEDKSGRFYLAFMENISKMKAGEGNESKINEAMNYLYDVKTSEVVDVKTGDLVSVSGSALESPSLYAILAGKKIEVDEVANYASDRVLKTVENKLGGASAWNAISTNVASSDLESKGTIGRINEGGETGKTEILELVTPTVSSSLVDNSYETINGIQAGEFLVEGAINIGKELAKMSGGTPGDETAVSEYARLNNKIIALDAEADRLNRSPFDVSSKNTFLGSIFYNVAMIWQNARSNTLAKSMTILSTTTKSLANIIPTTKAEDTPGYLTNIGDCETFSTIGAVGSAQCAEIATFDTSTLNDIFNDAGFISFVENNTTLNSSGSRTINNDSVLASFILNNNKRITPLGITDGGIISSQSNSSKIPFVSNILEMVKSFLNTDSENKRIASGEAFVNSSSNPDWQTYKYAQRYVSLARATAALKQYADDETAYNSIKFFEGTENPVIAFLNNYRNIANK
ncbi:hypothetical protein IKD82_02660 [Candidatus Saccharibacteria bacterium]|nr:hypothetical protein [Candidatus Saccharibacteria bacterium]